MIGAEERSRELRAQGMQLDAAARAAPGSRRLEAVREGTSASKPLELVWVVTPSYSITAAGLKKALEGKADVCIGGEPSAATSPSCVVLYAGGTEEGCLDGMGRIRELYPGVPLLVLGSHLDLALAWATLKNGADGFVHAQMDLVGAGDIARCDDNSDRATARLLGKIPGTVFTLGDNAYPDGTRVQFGKCYRPTWGKYKKRTKPTVGNHEYDSPGARPYFDYFGARAGKPGRGYYSYDRGSWHIVTLNSNCDEVGCRSRSRQARWLRRDLAKNRSRCTLAYFHHPLRASGSNYDSPEVRRFWTILDNRGADVILSAHAHRYERFAPMTPRGKRSDRGIRQFIVGTGGAPGGRRKARSTPTCRPRGSAHPGS